MSNVSTTSQIRLVRELINPENRMPSQLTILGHAEGVDVIVGTETITVLSWDSLTNMEHLVNEFKMLRVWQFQIVIDLLGQIYRMKLAQGE